MADYKNYIGNYNISNSNWRISSYDGNLFIVESQNNVNFQLGFYDNDEDLDSLGNVILLNICSVKRHR